MSPTLVVRREEETDYAAVYEIHRLAFGREDEARLTDLLRQGAGFVPELSLVAVSGTEAVGHLILTRGVVFTNSGSVEILALGPIGVVPERQRQGVGSLLMWEAIRRARELGFGAVALIGHPQYYPRFGFRPGAEFGLQSTYDVPDDVFVVLELTEGALEGVTGTFHFPPEFAGI